MDSLYTPKAIPMAFCNTGDKNEIPAAPTGTNKASLSEGFPAITSLPSEEGGIPPDRLDFNGAMNLNSQFYFAFQNGWLPTFNPQVSEAIGGYPLNAKLWYVTPEASQLLESIKPNNADNFIENPSVIGSSWKVVIKNGEFVKINGDTMTGQLVMAGGSGGINFEGATIPAPNDIDENTLGVWHFDGNQEDVVSGLLFNSSYTNPVFDTSIYKFGTASIKDRNNNYDPFISSALFTDRDLLRTNWTMDCWFYYKNTNSRMLMGPISGNSVVSGDGIRIYEGKMYVYLSDEIVYTQTETLSNNSWYHLALQSVWDGSSNNNEITAFLNGKQVYQGTNTSINNGYGLSFLDSYNVLLDELRISSVARYSGDFDPLSVPYELNATITNPAYTIKSGPEGLMESGVGLGEQRILTAADLPGTTSGVGFINTSAGISVAQGVDFIAPSDGWIIPISVWVGIGNDSYLPLQIYINGVLVSSNAWAARDGRDGYGQASHMVPVRKGQTILVPGNIAAVSCTFYPFL